MTKVFLVTYTNGYSDPKRHFSYDVGVFTNKAAADAAGRVAVISRVNAQGKARYNVKEFTINQCRLDGGKLC